MIIPLSYKGVGENNHLVRLDVPNRAVGEALTFHPDHSAWSGQFSFDASRGFVTIHPDA
jgi:hypothetical protein